MKSMCKKMKIIQQQCFLHGINLSIRDILYSKSPISQTIEFDTDAVSETDEDDHSFFIVTDEMDEDIQFNSELIIKVRNVMKKFKY